MFYDALSLRAYFAEVRQRFPLPWYVQKLSQVSDHDYLLSCRLGPKRNLRWLISLQPNAPGLRWWRGDKPQARPPSSFTMLCRKHLQGRSLHSAEAIYPERLVRLAGPEHVLVIELLERQPNMLLLDLEGKILGGHRLGRGEDRDLRPRRTYALPPRPDVPDAERLSGYQLEEIYLADPPSWPQSLLGQCFGLSPKACSRLSSQLADLKASWQAMWAQTVPGAYQAERLANGRLSIWGNGPEKLALLDVEHDEQSAPLPGLEMQRQRAAGLISKQQGRLKQRLQKLEGDREKVADADRVQREGELLLTYGHSVPKGASVAKLTDWDGVTPVELQLDPALPVVRQAQQRLKRAAKYRRSLPIVEQRVNETRAELERLDEARYQLAQLDSLDELRELLAAYNPARQKPAGKQPAGPRTAGPRRYKAGNYVIYVGRSPKQNDMLVQKLSARDDLWFHVKDAPGAHVVLKTGGRSPEPEIVEAAAVLAARYSSRASEAKVLVSFTASQRVKKPSNAPAGFVIYSEELTLWVRPDAEPTDLQRDES